MFAPLVLSLWACSGDDGGGGGGDSGAGADDSATDDTAPALPTHWEMLPPMPTARYALGCAAVGADVYAISGFGVASDPYRTDVEVLSDGVWSARAPMSVARDYFLTAPRPDGSFVVIGGFSKGSANALLHYAPGDDAWSSLGSFPNRVTPFGGSITKDRVVIAGGSYDWSTPTSDTTLLDLSSGEVTAVAPLPDAFVYAASATVGDRVYVSGGTEDLFTLGTRDDLLVYDAVADAWSSLAPFPGGPIDGHAMVALHDHLYVIGGYADSATALATVWRYDIATDTWDAADPLPNPIADACAVAVDDRIVVMGGTREPVFPIDEALAYVP